MLAAPYWAYIFQSLSGPGRAELQLPKSVRNAKINDKCPLTADGGFSSGKTSLSRRLRVPEQGESAPPSAEAPGGMG